MSLLILFPFAVFMLRDDHLKSKNGKLIHRVFLSDFGMLDFHLNVDKSNVFSVAFFANNSRGFITDSILPIRPPSCDHVANKCVKYVKINQIS